MMLVGFDWPTAFTITCLSVSSTLLVLRALNERHLRNREEGNIVVGLLLAQDMALAPLMVILSIVLPRGDGDSHQTPFWLMAAGVVALVTLTVFCRQMFASRVVSRIRATKQSELEVAFAILTALGSAWLTMKLALA